MARQTFRFVDGALDYSPVAVSMLVRALQTNAPGEREEFFTGTRKLRRRQHAEWQTHPVAQASQGV
jgi:hypothetical protein